MRTKEPDWSAVPGIEIASDTQSGAPVFAGTRVPVNVVTNKIHQGGTKGEIDAILDNFNVTRDQIDLVLRQLRRVQSRPLASARP